MANVRWAGARVRRTALGAVDPSGTIRLGNPAALAPSMSSRSPATSATQPPGPPPRSSRRARACPPLGVPCRWPCQRSHHGPLRARRPPFGGQGGVDVSRHPRCPPGWPARLRQGRTIRWSLGPQPDGVGSILKASYRTQSGPRRLRWPNASVPTMSCAAPAGRPAGGRRSERW